MCDRYYMDIDNELEQFASDAGREKGYKVPLKFDPLFDGVEFQLPKMEIVEPKRPARKIIINNATRNPKGGLF